MGHNDLGVSNLETQSLQELIIGTEIEAVSLPITVKNGATYKRGAVLAKHSGTGQYEAYDEDGLNGLDAIAAILVEDVDATGGVVKTTGYVTGIFNKDALVTEENFELGVHNTHGLIIIKELID